MTKYAIGNPQSVVTRSVRQPHHLTHFLARKVSLNPRRESSKAPGEAHRPEQLGPVGH